MGDMEPVASVQSHTALEHRARCVARAMPGSWDVHHVHNSGTGATLTRRTSRAWSAAHLRQLESMACSSAGSYAPTSATASVNTRSECVHLRVKFGGGRARRFVWVLLCLAAAAGAYWLRSYLLTASA